MRELEHRFPSELAVVGVHSGKYHAERDAGRIREAAIRLDLSHPVCNDRQFRAWRAYAVNAWPTLVVVDPTGRVIATHAGEFTAEELATPLERLIAEYDGRGLLDRRPLSFPLDAPAIAPDVLRYPGKVALDGGGRPGTRIAIADSGHHRIVVARLDPSGRSARVERVVGAGESGLEDGPGDRARFNYPQGLAFDSETLYVADEENHAVRAVDLTTGDVRTLAGTGRQLRTRADRQAGALSSPWDLALVGDTLFVAMAGIHQLWALDRDASGAWGRPRVHSGTRHEDIVDGVHNEADLAQPMGLAADAATGRLYFVDAESSAVRWADVRADGAVGTLVGTGLFDFGDVDGAGDDVRMQHQQGLALHESGRLLVADSYNDALKWLDPATRTAETWVRGFHEPGGVACGDRYAYVADTNAHRIATVDWRTGEVGELSIER